MWSYKSGGTRFEDKIRGGSNADGFDYGLIRVADAGSTGSVEVAVLEGGLCPGVSGNVFPL